MACDQSEKVHLFQNLLSLAPTSRESVRESLVTSTSSGGLGGTSEVVRGTFEVIVVIMGFFGGGGLRDPCGGVAGSLGRALGGFGRSVLAVVGGFSGGGCLT